MKKLTGISGFFLLSSLLAIILAAGIAKGQSNTLAAKQTTGAEKESVQNRSRDLLETWMPKDIIPFSFMCDGRSSAELLKKEKDKPGVYSALNGTLQVIYELKEYQQNGCVEWGAMQFHRTDLDAGMVLFYRRPLSPYISARFPLHGLSANTDYLIDNDGDLLKTVKGSELMDEGLQVMAELPRTANIIFYRKAIK